MSETDEKQMAAYRIRRMTQRDLPQVMVIERENFSLPWSEKSFREMLPRPETVFLVAEQDAAGENGKAVTEQKGKTAAGTEQCGAAVETARDKTDILMECPRKILGYAGAVMAMDEGDVTNIAVLETQKRKGIATALLNALIHETITAGVRDLFLEVREHNVPALGLYRAAGFAEVGRRKGYYDKPKEDALILKRSSG